MGNRLPAEADPNAGGCLLERASEKIAISGKWLQRADTARHYGHNTDTIFLCEGAAVEQANRLLGARRVFEDENNVNGALLRESGNGENPKEKTRCAHSVTLTRKTT
jgi:hypothetical protein